MANKFLDGNGLLYFWQKIKAAFATKDELNNSKVTVTDNLTSTSNTDALSANQGKVLDEKIKAINDGLGELGGGDMLKSQYDTNNDGKVDNAENADKLGGQSADYYAKATDLNSYVPTSKVGQASGVASLGADGKVPESQLPETAPIEHTHEISEVNGLQDELDDMVAVAQGKCSSYVFDTVDELDTWLGNTENTANLKTGDAFYIRAVDVPDYWWDGDTSSKQILETTKVDLTTITNAEIDTIVAS